MKDVYDLSTMSKALHMTNFYKKQKTNGSVCIQHKNFQELPIGIFKVEKTLNTDIMKYIFMESNVNWQDKTRQDKTKFGACGQNHKEHM